MRREVQAAEAQRVIERLLPVLRGTSVKTLAEVLLPANQSREGAMTPLSMWRREIATKLTHCHHKTLRMAAAIVSADPACRGEDKAVLVTYAGTRRAMAARLLAGIDNPGSDPELARMVERANQRQPASLSLAQWASLYDVPISPAGEARVVAQSPLSDEARWQLWHLSDYRVSSVTGGSVWLMPR